MPCFITHIAMAVVEVALRVLIQRALCSGTGCRCTRAIRRWRCDQRPRSRSRRCACTVHAHDSVRVPFINPALVAATARISSMLGCGCGVLGLILSADAPAMASGHSGAAKGAGIASHQGCRRVVCAGAGALRRAAAGGGAPGRQHGPRGRVRAHVRRGRPVHRRPQRHPQLRSGTRLRAHRPQDRAAHRGPLVSLHREFV